MEPTAFEFWWADKGWAIAKKIVEDLTGEEHPDKNECLDTHSKSIDEIFYLAELAMKELHPECDDTGDAIAPNSP